MESSGGWDIWKLTSQTSSRVVFGELYHDKRTWPSQLAQSSPEGIMFLELWAGEERQGLSCIPAPREFYGER